MMATHMRRVFIVLAAVLATSSAYGTWSNEKLEAATTALQQYQKKWRLQDTVSLIEGKYVDPASTTPTVTFGGEGKDHPPSQITASIVADDRREISVTIMGESMIVDGKDVTGNLGSKTTYGANSPILGSINSSQVVIGGGNSVAKDTTESTNNGLQATGTGNVAGRDMSANSTKSITVNVSLSIALTISATLNAYLLRREIRRRAVARKAAPEPT